MRIAVLFASLLSRTPLFATWLLTAATLAVAAPATLAPSQFNSEATVDSSALGTRVPVVLVHGLGGSGQGWENFLQAYARNPAWRNAFKPYTFKYSSATQEVLTDPTGPRTISGLGAALRDAMQNYYDRPAAAPGFGFANKPAIVMAHSMGGLVARSMMQEHSFQDGRRGGDKVLHLITLGTPHHGTPMADAGVALQSLTELSEGYAGFVADMAWTNFDGLDMSSGRCNPWLARLNSYASWGGANFGSCGNVLPNVLTGYYEKIVAYGAGTLQTPDLDLGLVGVYQPGSSSSLLLSHEYLRNGLARSYRNDGMVPIVSAQFAGPALWQRADAFDCDHRYLERGYPEFVRSPAATYSDWAFCAGTNSEIPYPSGVSGGYAVSGSILGVPGGIIDTIKTASEAERVLAWGEQGFAQFLQPAGAATQIWGGYYYRYYPATQAFVGIKDGNVYYQGPASGQQIRWVATSANFLAFAQAAGF